MNIDNLEIPKIIEKTLYVYMYTDTYRHNQIVVSEFEYAEETDRVLLLTIPFSVEIPKGLKISDLKNSLIEKLENERDRLRLEYHVKEKNIIDKINSLLAIEHKED